jgi:HKD family nuclease
MDVDLILQPFEDESSLHGVLAEALLDDRYDHVDVVVAWTKDAGLDRLREQFTAFHGRAGTSSRLITGLDEGGATREGLESALTIFDDASLLYDSASGTFHPKLYLFTGPERAKLIIGSNNFTPGGLFYNYEAAQVTDFDGSDNRAVVDRVQRYIRRLQEDDTSRPLTADLIEELAAEGETVLGSEAREQGDASSERRPSRGYRRLRELFGRSRHAKKRDPRPRRRPNASGRGGGSGTPAPPTGAIVARWTKKLTRSDCGQPRPGSNTTGALRFTKAGQALDQTGWFREVLFGDAAWGPDGRPGRERAAVTFDVKVDGVSRGTHDLVLKHDARRESSQNNFTTDLKWGSLNPVLREHDAVGEWVIIDKHEDGNYAITIQPDEPAQRFVTP